MTPIRELPDGLRECREFGADAQCNGHGFAHYVNDIAYYFGKEKWSDLTKEQKDSAYKEFLNGKQEELEASQWIHIQD